MHLNVLTMWTVFWDIIINLWSCWYPWLLTQLSGLTRIHLTPAHSVCPTKCNLITFIFNSVAYMTHPWIKGQHPVGPYRVIMWSLYFYFVVKVWSEMRHMSRLDSCWDCRATKHKLVFSLSKQTWAAATDLPFMVESILSNLKASACFKQSACQTIKQHLNPLFSWWSSCFSVFLGLLVHVCLTAEVLELDLD